MALSRAYSVLNKDKCNFDVQELVFLGDIVDAEGMTLDLEKYLLY